MLTLKATIRDTKVSPDSLRKAGKIPAVFYGKKQASTPITISLVDFKKAWDKAGESSVIAIETGEETVESLIHDVDLDPVTGTPRHADFYVFEKGHKVSVDVPLEFVGEAPAVKDLKGTLVKVLYALKIEAMPKDLPHNLTVDVSALVTFESQILAQDIALPTGVSLVEKPEEVVALVSAPREEKEEEAAPIDLAAIEVAEKGKKPEEGEPAAEEAAA